MVVPGATASADTLGQTVTFTTGSQPVSVSLAPDSSTAYVVMRHARQLVRVTGESHE